MAKGKGNTGTSGFSGRTIGRMLSKKGAATGSAQMASPKKKGKK